jgi:hypothetical protein
MEMPSVTINVYFGQSTYFMMSGDLVALWCVLVLSNFLRLGTGSSTQGVVSDAARLVGLVAFISSARFEKFISFQVTCRGSPDT